MVMAVLAWTLTWHVGLASARNGLWLGTVAVNGSFTGSYAGVEFRGHVSLLFENALTGSPVTGLVTESATYKDGTGCSVTVSDQDLAFAGNAVPQRDRPGPNKLNLSWGASDGNYRRSESCPAGEGPAILWWLYADPPVPRNVAISGTSDRMAGRRSWHFSAPRLSARSTIRYDLGWYSYDSGAPAGANARASQASSCALIKAIVKPEAATRGKLARIDGSSSFSRDKNGKRQRVQSYHWTIKPVVGCPGKTVSRRTARVSFIALCVVVAPLEVQDAQGRTASTKDPVVVPVIPRQWKTPFAFKPGTSLRWPPDQAGPHAPP